MGRSVHGREGKGRDGKGRAGTGRHAHAHARAGTDRDGQGREGGGESQRTPDVDQSTNPRRATELDEPRQMRCVNRPCSLEDCHNQASRCLSPVQSAAPTAVQGSVSNCAGREIGARLRRLASRSKECAQSLQARVWARSSPLCYASHVRAFLVDPHARAPPFARPAPYPIGNARRAASGRDEPDVEVTVGHAT